MHIFFQNGDLLLYFQVATIPYPRTLTAYPTTVLRGTPGFVFHQNDRKGCKRDYLDAWVRFVLRFGAIGEKPLGGAPLRNTRVKQTNLSLTQV